MDASGVGLGAGLLQVRDNLNWRYQKLPENTMLWSIELASKSLSNME